MTPVKTPETNFTYVAPGCRDLPCHITDKGICIATFTLTNEERDLLAVDGLLRVHIAARPIPPIYIEAIPCVK